MKSFLLFLLGVALIATPFATYGQAFNDFEQSPHDYYDRAKKDAMTALVDLAEEGKHSFGTETGLPLLRQLLADLKIPESSQILVFSKTSMQRRLVSPQVPRSMYFNEDVYVTRTPGGKIEVNSFDGVTGGLFFFEKPPLQPGDTIQFEEPSSCLGCHAGSATNFLPGPLARSHYTGEDGRRLASVKSHERIGHQIPFSDRWGGYFVTGAPDSLDHLGNTFSYRQGETVSLKKVENATSLFDPALHLRTDSHILPLMLFDHQIEMHNLLMEAVYRDRQDIYLAAQNGGEIPKDDARKSKRFFERLVRYLVFADEQSLAGHAITEYPEYQSAFLRDRRPESSGASLKDFDLRTRLFENRLSYMIYSDSFVGAPATMKDRVYDRLAEILLLPEAPEGFDYFDEGERERIVKILRSTKRDLPKSWQED